MSVPLHKHDDVESFYVLEGEMSFFLDDQPGVRTGSGGFVHIPGGSVHGFRVESEEARYLILTTPHHGDFYREITVPSLPGGKQPAESASMKGMGLKYGIEFVGPLPD